MIIVNEEWCKGCEICIEHCPVQALEKSDKLNKRGVYPPRLKPNNKCNYCRLCELLCPDFAITVIPNDNMKKQAKEVNLRSIGGRSK
jgi:2-oxoglutarate ferredoxin oxidoreductase subunit delta